MNTDGCRMDELETSVAIWNPGVVYPDRANEAVKLNVTSVELLDEGLVALHTVEGAEPLVWGGDNPAHPFTEEDEALVITLVGLEHAAQQEQEEGHE